MAQGYLIFHLNLAFSSINADARPSVIRNCYWPLLKMAECTKIPVGIELSGWTLQQIALLDPAWVEFFRQMLSNDQCELIGSGWSQIIGPLVPYEVNSWNQNLGLAAYRQMLGMTPRIALVNEMAFSSGMVDLYAESGYQGIIMDRDNVRLALSLNHAPLSSTPTHAQGYAERSLPVLWSDSILFQRLQRVVHGDIPIAEYLAYVKQRAEQGGIVLPIYCNDAEIFDYRPGRFVAESRLHPDGEWQRLQGVCSRLQQDLALDWLSPSAALAISSKTNPHSQRLTSVIQPIPVKKQAKYNVNRWAVTGRDDLWLNTVCHQLHQVLAGRGEGSDEDWRTICELWASDLRTHITPERWSEAVERINGLGIRLGLTPSPADNRSNSPETCPLSSGITLYPGIEIIPDEEGILWTITTPALCLVLNVRRGLAIASLAFKSHHFEPVIGTLTQGYFNTIELGADFYSGGILIEVPAERSRRTDLEWVSPRFQQDGRKLLISAQIALAQGTLKKTIVVDTEAEQVELTYDFQQIERPLGIVRVGIITFLPEFFLSPLTVQCVNGGAESECFQVDGEVDHGHATSAFVSSTSSLGATDGCLIIDDAKKRRLVLQWNPAACAAVPMLKHQRVHDRHLTRLSFSLCELDDTVQAGGRLLPFTLEISTRGVNIL